VTGAADGELALDQRAQRADELGRAHQPDRSARWRSCIYVPQRGTCHSADVAVRGLSR
jgi:hypothetical protein